MTVRTIYTIRRPTADAPHDRTDSAAVAEAWSRIGMVVTARTASGAGMEATDA